MGPESFPWNSITWFKKQIMWYVRVKHGFKGSNPFLRLKAAHLKLWPDFFGLGSIYSNMALKDPILFAAEGSPPKIVANFDGTFYHQKGLSLSATGPMWDGGGKFFFARKEYPYKY